MFKESDNNPQLDMFPSPSGMLQGSMLADYLKKDAWHNIFREHVVARVNEDIFKMLYSSYNGTSNALVRILVGMMILKVGQGCSDEQLFEQCRFNMLFRSTLGLMNLTGNLPAASTYYLFRKKVMEYNRENGADLFKECMRQITREQILDFSVSDKKEINNRFVAMGMLMHRFLKLFKKHDYGEYKTLCAVFEQQFAVTPDKAVLPLEKEKISAQSVQSAHDADAHYRDKGGKKMKGFSVNLTETCDDPKSDDSGDRALNLITDINLDAVSTPDSEFLEPSLEESQALLDDKIGEVYADGAYHSQSNQIFVQEKEMELILTGIQGKPSRYELSLGEENTDELLVFDTCTQTFIKAYLAAASTIDGQTGKPEKKWRIKTDEGKYSYFTLESVRSSMLRQKLRDVPIEEKLKRNNVEASMFQIGFTCNNGKTRYCGIAANQLWAYSLTTWINFRRILKYVMQTSKRALSSQKGLAFSIKIWIYIKINVNTLINNLLNNSRPKYLNFSGF